jgi:hypothetical protein
MQPLSIELWLTVLNSREPFADNHLRAFSLLAILTPS